MKQGLIGVLLAVIWCWGQPAVADALMQSQALKASTISQYFIDEKGVRVELEIGAESVERFRNLLPDAIYQQFGYGDTPRAERLQTFSARIWPSSPRAQPCRDSWLKSGRPAGYCATRSTVHPCRYRTRRPMWSG